MRSRLLILSLGFLILLTCASASPITDIITKRREPPNSDAPLGQLEGLPACYAKCMISEAHHSFYDPWTQSVHEWCRHYYGVLGFTARWMNYHFLPCLVKNCPRHHESNLKGAKKWWDEKCKGFF